MSTLGHRTARLVAPTLVALTLAFATGAAAQQAPHDKGADAPSGPQLGAILDDLLRPGGAVDDMTDMARRARDAIAALERRAGTWADALGAVMADPDAYEPPQTLPNGDIIIRKRAAPRESHDGPVPPPVDL